MQICGGPGLEDCSGCGGALCGLALGKRKCGGPNCDGVVPVSQKASEAAERVKDQLITLPSRLQESKNKAGLHFDAGTVTDSEVMFHTESGSNVSVY